MNIYTKNINGKVVKKHIKDIHVCIDGIFYSNPSHNMVVSDGWEPYVLKRYTDDELLNIAKNKKKKLILSYDSSSNVNIFYIQDIPVWLDKNTRAGLMLRFQSELALNKTYTTLWYKGMNFTLQLNSAMSMLYAIENYASQCYDRTQMHLSEIDKMETRDEVKAYDHKNGYPDKLYF